LFYDVFFSDVLASVPAFVSSHRSSTTPRFLIYVKRYILKSLV